MSGQNMIGVVLWTDEAAQRAVIWCEDHGDLAYYSASERNVFEGATCEFESGDLIEFELTQHRHLRYAHNLRVVTQADRPGLAYALTDSASNQVASAPAPRRSMEAVHRQDNLIELRRVPANV